MLHCVLSVLTCSTSADTIQHSTVACMMLKWKTSTSNLLNSTVGHICSTSATWWCSCGCCVQMDTEEESLCCREGDNIQPNVSQDSAQCVKIGLVQI